MALQVWLPLNGNLNNQGLSNLSFSNVNTSYTTVNDSGKIGKCYNNNTYGGGGLVSDKTINLGQKQSMFCWFMFTSLGSNSSLGGAMVGQHRYPTNQGMGLTIKYVSSTTGYLSINTGNGSSRTYNTYCATTLMSANTWYHGGYTYDGSTIKIYLNGVCENTISYTGMSVPADYIQVFSWSFNSSTGNVLYGGYHIIGSMNDVRIYDHCLSPKEVKEISKGLVCHYKLDDVGIRENLFTGGFSVYKTSTTVTKTGGLNTIPAATILANKGKTLILSAYVYSKGQSANTDQSHNRFGIHGMIQYTKNGASSPTQDYPLCLFTPGADGRVSITWTIPTDITSVNTVLSFADQASTTSGYWARPADAGVTWYYKDVKLEWGTTPTMYTSTNAVSNTIYDCSGFGRNGIISGNLVKNTDTTRYGQCVKNTDEYVSRSSSSIGFPQSSGLTIACWMNLTVWGFQESGIWATSNNAANPSDYNTTTCHHRDYGFDIRGTNGTTYRLACSSSDIPLNTWKHVAFTHDGVNAKLYINGALVRTVSVPTPLVSFDYIFLGYSNAGGVARKCQGSWSDFRVYATALSADSIKELYNTSAFITNNGTIGCYEFIESSNGQTISKNGIVGSPELYENDAHFPLNVTIAGTGVTNSHPTNASNVCTNGYTVHYPNIEADKKYVIELDFSWGGNWTFDASQSSAFFWQGTNNDLWQGTNYLVTALRNACNLYSLVKNTTTGGTYHCKATFSMPASHLQTYNRSNIGTRCDYQNGTGYFSFTNLKIYPYDSAVENEQAKIGNGYITGRNLLEI